MPSLADIPDDLKRPEAKDAFIEWIFELAIDLNTGRALIHLWSSLTRTKLSKDEWLDVESKLKGR